MSRRPIKKIRDEFLTPKAIKKENYSLDYLEMAMPIINSIGKNSLKHAENSQRFSKFYLESIRMKQKKSKFKNSPPPTPYNTTEYICKNQKINEEILLQKLSIDNDLGTLIQQNQINSISKNNESKCEKRFTRSPMKDLTVILGNDQKQDVPCIFDLFLNSPVESSK